MLSGGGHGFLQPLYIVFPYSILLTQIFTEETGLLFLVMFIQFPIYGFIIDKYKTSKTLFLILLLHLIAIICVFLLENKIE